MEDHQNEKPSVVNGTLPELNVTVERKLTSEEALRLENFNLRNENLQLREERYVQEGISIQAERKRLVQETTQLRTILATKHGIAPEKLKIRQDGTIEETK